MPASTNPTLNAILVFVVVPFVVILFLSAWRRRDSIVRRVRIIVVTEGIYLGVALLLIKIGRPPVESLLAGVLAAVIVASRIPSRKRYVPASARRRAIARYELKTGQKFNPRKHEIDHEIAFARGGGHTADNLRVMEKSANRAKGKKSPWWDLLARR